MNVLVTGSSGFIGKNLVVRLEEHSGVRALHFGREQTAEDLHDLVANVDAVVHLAGENRPNDDHEFTIANAQLTSELCRAIAASRRQIPLIFTSSAQAEHDNPYGVSKRIAETSVRALASDTGNPCLVYRLPGVFGKWCRPNYNSVVATFCHNIARDLPIIVNDANSTLRLVYIDDVIESFIQALLNPSTLARRSAYQEVEPEYSISLGELADQIRAFRNCRTDLRVERVGSGLTRALYSTYLTYLPSDRFAYSLPRHGDSRGIFVEMLKTSDSGQVSFFTAPPGVTRGQHYHHSKTEKFLVVNGRAQFNFRHLVTGEQVEILSNGVEPTVVDTIPGWVHSITNIGDDVLVVMLWANENFDHQSPDTLQRKV